MTPAKFCPIGIAFQDRTSFVRPYEHYADLELLLALDVPASSCVRLHDLTVERLRAKAEFDVPFDAVPHIARGVVDWDQTLLPRPSPVECGQGELVEPADLVEFRRAQPSLAQKETDILDHRPRWDEDRKTLYFDGIEVKRYRRPADNQLPIIRAFDEEGWPTKIDDPLPPSHGIDSKKRLSDTVAKINRSIRSHGVLRFELDSTGEGVLWLRTVGT